MPKGQDSAPARCPHCGRMMRVGSLVRHLPLCVENPETAARYRAALVSKEDSGRGIACARYIELSMTDATLPAVNTLRRATGCKTWDKLLATFDLLPPAVEVKLIQCPHCCGWFDKYGIGPHKATCPKAQPKPPPAPKPSPKPSPKRLPPPAPKPSHSYLAPSTNHMNNRNVGKLLLGGVLVSEAEEQIVTCGLQSFDAYMRAQYADWEAFTDWALERADLYGRWWAQLELR